MALANKKSEELYNRKTGGDADSKTIDSEKETILQNAFTNKEYINDKTNLLFNAGLVYIVQQMQEDIEELRRYVSSDIDTLTTAQSNAITTNSAKVSQGLNTANHTMSFDVVNSKGTYSLVITVVDSSGKGTVTKTATLTLS